MSNPKSFNPFLPYSQQLNVLLAKAKDSDNPAWFLYQNGARNIIFMLEGLTRLHHNAFDQNKMGKWYERFKKMEDYLGQIDFLDAFKIQFELEHTLPEKSIEKLGKVAQSIVKDFNKFLLKKGWLEGKMKKFDAFILEKNYQYDAKYTIEIVEAYNDEILDIVEFAHEIRFQFRELELELHEMRRNLRWLSIYPQAFGGLFQFRKSENAPEWSEKYMTEKIVNSPFNKLPVTVENLPTIHLDYHCFLGLSYLIQAFGALKDEGLTNFVVIHHLGYTKAAAKEILGEKYTDEREILREGSGLLKSFFEDRVLENLVV
jgi:hypothetical protein